VGKDFIAKYPEMEVVAEMEGHARHTGVHAAGIIVCNNPISDFGSFDHRSGCICLDKKDSVVLNMLKIDVLGLRTLSVLEECCKLAGIDFHDLYDLPLDDQKAFSIFNDAKLSGIFQFEGYALFNLTKQMGVRNFNDIVSITALARPGPLHSGSATLFIDRRIGKSEVTYFHPHIKQFTEETQGTIVYQEQVMKICRGIGRLSWSDIKFVRKAMSDSLGDEYFSQYWEKFRRGCLESGVGEDDAKTIWDNMCTFGSWAFNKSHAVSYGLISYWCAYLKAHYPLEFAAAQLIHAKDPDQGVKLLRELVNEGYKFVPFDPERSEENWVIDGDILIGGFLNIKGVGPAKAQELMRRRAAQIPYTPAQQRLLYEGETPYDHIFEGRDKYGHVYDNPDQYKIKTRLTMVEDIDEPGTYVFIGKIKDLNLRDLNEYNTQKIRTGEFKRIERNNLFLNMVVEDDTDNIICTINRWKYHRFGKPLVERNAKGEWFVFKGQVKDGWRKVYVEKLRPLEAK
jgi:DNA polymerase III alpha subunit